MARSKAEALKLPDSLLVRYFRGGEIEKVKRVQVKDTLVTVQVGARTDHWRDLGGGLGFVPTDAES